MLKGAIILLAFSLFYSGCKTSMPIQPSPPLPQTEPFTFVDEYRYDFPEEKIERIETEKVEKEEKIQLTSLPPEPKLPEEPLKPMKRLELPDLTLNQLFLHHKRRVVATLTNVGTHPFPTASGNLNLFVDGRFEKSYNLQEFSKQPFILPQETVNVMTPLTLYGRHEVEARIDTGKELDEVTKENNQLKRILEGLPIGPDIVIKDLNLTEDMELSIILSNAGEAHLRKGVTFRCRIFVNDRKISDFDHFTSDVLRAHSANHYTLEPPYRITIKGIFRVKVSISPKLHSDDIRLENNILERRFIIFPFQIGAQGKEEFSFSVPISPPKGEEPFERVRVEVRWEGTGDPLKLSFMERGGTKELQTVSGKSPLKVELPMVMEETQRENLWQVSVTNPIEKRVEGHIIIQHP